MLPSMSQWDRWLACQHAPPEFDAGEEVWSKPARDRGNAVHLLHEVGPGRADEVIQKYPDYEPLIRMILANKHTCSLLWPDWLSVRREVAYALNVDECRGRELVVDRHRGYKDVGDREIPGTLDQFFVDNGMLYVRDIKTGRSHGTAAHSSQLRLQACAVGGGARCMIGYINIGDDGSAFLDEAEFTDSVEFMDRIRQAVDRIRAGADAAPGAHCGWCRERHTCGEYLSFGASGSADAPRFADWALTQRGRLKLYDYYRACAALADDAKVALMKAGAEVELPNGKVYGATEISKRSVDPSIGSQVVAEIAGPDVAMRTAKMTMTASAIKKAAPEKWESIEEEIGKRGGFKRSTYTIWTERRPGQTSIKKEDD